MRIALVVLAIAFAAPALAQQQPDIPTLQRAIGALAAQRNNAMDQAANAQVQAAILADENTKLKARIEELEKVKPVDGK